MPLCESRSHIYGEIQSTAHPSIHFFASFPMKLGHGKSNEWQIIWMTRSISPRSRLLSAQIRWMDPKNSSFLRLVRRSLSLAPISMLLSETFWVFATWSLPNQEHRARAKQLEDKSFDAFCSTPIRVLASSFDLSTIHGVWTTGYGRANFPRGSKDGQKLGLEKQLEVFFVVVNLGSIHKRARKCVEISI